MKRITFALLGAVLVVLGFWLGGLDLTVRGPVLAYCYIMSIAAAAAVYFSP